MRLDLFSVATILFAAFLLARALLPAPLALWRRLAVARLTPQLEAATIERRAREAAATIATLQRSVDGATTEVTIEVTLQALSLTRPAPPSFAVSAKARIGGGPSKSGHPATWSSRNTELAFDAAALARQLVLGDGVAPASLFGVSGQLAPVTLSVTVDLDTLTAHERLRILRASHALEVQSPSAAWPKAVNQ